jgi:hypothetical protein
MLEAAMSNKAINWAKQQKLRSSTKSLLIILADHANDLNLCWPSHVRLKASTNLDRKTIIRGLKKLQELKLISDTERRKGKSNRTKVYYLNLDVSLPNEKDDNMSPFRSTRNSESIGPKKANNDPCFSGGQFRKRDSEPLPNPHSSLKEPREGCIRRGLRGSGSCDIASFINTDEDFDEVRRLAPGWDKYALFRMFDAHFEGRGEIRNHHAAFFGWLRRFTKGQPPKGTRQQYGDP